MRGTYRELDALRRAVVHALELALEDAERWAATLDDEAIEAEPYGLLSVGWQLRHTARSLDRLLTYAEGRMLDAAQLAALATERERGPAGETMAALREGVRRAIERVRAVEPEQYEAAREIGRKRLPTTAGGLLVHCAEHTQRHAGQMVTTAKLVAAMRSGEVWRT